LLRLLGRLAEARSRLRAHWRSARTALTALYTVFFLVSGAVLLAIIFGLGVRMSSRASAVAPACSGPTPTVSGGRGAACGVPPGGPGQPSLPRLPSSPGSAVQQHAIDLHGLLISSGIAFAAMTVAAAWIGWLMAGRVLRPIRRMTTATRQISAYNLHERLALHGPQDEVKDLADTIDDLLGRLETAFAAQRRFIANAAHELSTPLTLERALLEVALAEPGASAESLRATCEEVLTSNEDQGRLIEALLTLATSERGLDRWDPVELAALARHALGVRQDEADRRGLQVGGRLAPAHVAGNGDLLERLVANLVDNALRYNVPGGWLEVDTAEAGGRAILSVRNRGPVVPGDEVGRLFRPFQRLGGERTGGAGGHGLGLSIVAAIASAHDAELTARAQPNGGLDIQVRFPPLAGSHRPGVAKG